MASITIPPPDGPARIYSPDEIAALQTHALLYAPINITQKATINEAAALRSKIAVRYSVTTYATGVSGGPSDPESISVPALLTDKFPPDVPLCLYFSFDGGHDPLNVKLLMAEFKRGDNIGFYTIASEVYGQFSWWNQFSAWVSSFWGS